MIKTKLKILMDYILEKNETQIEEFKTGSIYIDQNLNVCELTNKGYKILLKHSPEKINQSTNAKSTIAPLLDENSLNTIELSQAITSPDAAIQHTCTKASSDATIQHTCTKASSIAAIQQTCTHMGTQFLINAT